MDFKLHWTICLVPLTFIINKLSVSCNKIRLGTGHSLKWNRSRRHIPTAVNYVVFQDYSLANWVTFWARYIYVSILGRRTVTGLSSCWFRFASCRCGQNDMFRYRVSVNNAESFPAIRILHRFSVFNTIWPRLYCISNEGPNWAESKNNAEPTTNADTHRKFSETRHQYQYAETTYTH